jgi:methyltransferase-like protein/SAM-dependent methyltransferase
MTSDQLQQSYDEVPYPDLCYTQTHPDRLATLATLLGLAPAPIGHCRVLELGCASGGNLIPMAYGLPDSEFVGIDFSATQINAGRQVIAALQLDNINLQQQNLLDLAPDFGRFDYIIAHGVYSWVPAPVRDQLLAICKESLADNGIAYVSYNTYPGWHMLEALRRMMLYHTRHVADPRQKVVQARQLLDFLAESVPGSEDPYSTFSLAYGQMLSAYHSFVVQEREREHSGFELLLHDELEAINDPVYFHEFITQAAAHGLQYLVEADFARVMPSNLPPGVAQAMLKMSHDIIEMEQYMDFVRNRTLRQTLLCHDDLNAQRALRPDPERLAPFYIATYAQPVTPDINIPDQSVIQFRGLDGSLLSIDHPVSKAAMLHLARISPQAVAFDELLKLARRQIAQEAPAGLAKTEPLADAQALAANILKAYSYSTRLVELHVHAPRFTLHAGPRPLVPPLARLQAQAGTTKVTNLRHERVRLDQISQHLLPYLDGQHSLTELLDNLLDLVEQGRIGLEHEGQQITDRPMLAEILEQELANNLQWLGRAALLES